MGYLLSHYQEDIMERMCIMTLVTMQIIQIWPIHIPGALLELASQLLLHHYSSEWSVSLCEQVKFERPLNIYIYIVTCQVHLVLVKWVQCTVRSFPPVNGPKDPWPRVLSLPGDRVVCWRPHPAGTRQYGAK